MFGHTHDMAIEDSRSVCVFCAMLWYKLCCFWLICLSDSCVFMLDFYSAFNPQHLS